MFDRWKRKKPYIMLNEEVFKIHILHDDSIKTFYHNRLNQQLETDKNIETKWRNIKAFIEEAAKEPIVKRRRYGAEGVLACETMNLLKEWNRRRGIAHVSPTKYRWCKRHL